MANKVAEITFGVDGAAVGDVLTLRAGGLAPGEHAHLEAAYPQGFDHFRAAVDGDGNLRKSFRVQAPDPPEDCVVEVKAYIHAHDPQLIAEGSFALSMAGTPQTLIERSITDGAKIADRASASK